MTTAGFMIAGLCGCLALANGVTTRRLWRSTLYERPQKVAQTVLVWLLPGAFVFTGYFLRNSLKNRPRPSTEADPTVDNSTPYIHGA